MKTSRLSLVERKARARVTRTAIGMAVVMAALLALSGTAAALFVATTHQGVEQRAMTSVDGETWNVQGLAGEGSWRVCHGNDVFVAVSYTGTTSNWVVATSPDGETWTQRTAPARDWWGCVWSETIGKFVAVGRAGVPSRSMTSPDGVTWTIGTLLETDWRAVAERDGLFVAVGNGYYGHSMDGVDWTEVELAGLVAEEVAVNADGTWLVTRPDAANQKFAWTTNPTAGNPWTFSTALDEERSFSIRYNEAGGLWVAASSDGKILTSPDLNTWTTRVDDGKNHRGIANSGSTVVVGSTVGDMYQSLDGGFTWTERSSGDTRSWIYVAASTEAESDPEPDPEGGNGNGSTLAGATGIELVRQIPLANDGFTHDGVVPGQVYNQTINTTNLLRSGDINTTLSSLWIEVSYNVRLVPAGGSAEYAASVYVNTTKVDDCGIQLYTETLSNEHHTRFCSTNYQTDPFNVSLVWVGENSTHHANSIRLTHQEYYTMSDIDIAVTTTALMQFAFVLWAAFAAITLRIQDPVIRVVATFVGFSVLFLPIEGKPFLLLFMGQGALAIMAVVHLIQGGRNR